MNEPSHPSSHLVDFVPLMRSPATWTPQPVTLPPDIHPLPEDISAYFVYPYTLEDFVLHPPAPHKPHAERIAKLHEEHSIRVRYLKEREEEKIRKKKEALRKVAPGYEPPEEDGSEVAGGSTSSTGLDEGHRKTGILEPTRKSMQTTISPVSPSLSNAEAETKQEEPKQRDVMDDLVEGLARMDEQEGKTGPS